MIRTPIFRYMYLGALFNTLALFVPFVFLIPYAKSQGINEVAAASLMGIIGGASIAGRLIFGALGDKVSSIRLFQATFFIAALSYLVWLLASDSFILLVCFAAFLGTGYGGFIALSPVVTAELFGLVGLGSILGAMYTAAGIGGLIGPPLAGYLIDRTGSYSPAILTAMIFGFIAFLFLIPILRYMKRQIQ